MDCPQCGFNADLVKTFQLSERGPFPERGRFARDPEHQKTLQFYAWFLSRLSHARILDLGSGPGTVAVPLCWLENVEGVACFDADAFARKALLETKAEKGLEKLLVHGEQGQPHALPYDTGEFDAVVCRYSMHHFPDQPGAMREMRRCLKDSGFLFYSDPAMPAHSRDATDCLYRKRESNFHGYRTYHEMVDLVTDHGFQIQAVRPYDYQRGTLDQFLLEQEPNLKAELIRDWMKLDPKTKEELKWSGLREGPFITYPIIDIVALKPETGAP